MARLRHSRSAPEPRYAQAGRRRRGELQEDLDCERERAAGGDEGARLVEVCLGGGKKQRLARLESESTKLLVTPAQDAVLLAVRRVRQWIPLGVAGHLVRLSVKCVSGFARVTPPDEGCC